MVKQYAALSIALIFSVVALAQADKAKTLPHNGLCLNYPEGQDDQYEQCIHEIEDYCIAKKLAVDCHFVNQDGDDIAAICFCIAPQGLALTK